MGWNIFWTSIFFSCTCIFTRCFLNFLHYHSLKVPQKNLVKNQEHRKRKCSFTNYFTPFFLFSIDMSEWENWQHLLEFTAKHILSIMNFKTMINYMYKIWYKNTNFPYYWISKSYFIKVTTTSYFHSEICDDFLSSFWNFRTEERFFDLWTRHVNLLILIMPKFDSWLLNIN